MEAKNFKMILYKQEVEKMSSVRLENKVESMFSLTFYDNIILTTVLGWHFVVTRGLKTN